MIILFIIFAISISGIITLLMRGSLRLRIIPKEEVLIRYNETEPFWSDFHTLIVAPTVRVHQEKVRPKTYKEIEKLARRFRIIVLKTECLLLRFSEYIKGKRTMPPSCNGHRSHYWEQLNNRQQGENGSSLSKRDDDNTQPTP